ncbi:MAG: hypothetical protein LC107_00065 [Chitinophagales bacterium]|nr:hypothetical protein [Chitinophagales bacterium]
MKHLILFLLITILVFVVSLVFPWWIAGVICFIICYLLKPGYFTAFAISLISVFLIWYLKAYVNDAHFDHPVSGLLSNLLGGIPTSSVFFLTGSIGGISAGLAGLLGHWTRKIVTNSKI